MQDFHETWIYSIDCGEQERQSLPVNHAQWEGRGFYESYDAKNCLVRCGLLLQVVQGTAALTAWPAEVKWIIRIPYSTEDYWMRIYKQALKRYHHRLQTKSTKQK